MSLAGQLVPVLMPVVLTAALGFVWRRLGVPFDREFVTRLVMNIGAPCLILGKVAGLDASAADFAVMLWAGALLTGGAAIIGLIALRTFRLPWRSFLPPIVFGNVGNLGLPLCYFAFGVEGLGLAMGIFLVSAVGQFALAPFLQSTEPVIRTLFATPLIYGAVIGMAVLFGGYELPLWLANTVGLIGDVTIPLMLLSLGYSLGGFGVRELGLPAGLAALRLSMGFALGVSVAELLDLEGVMRGVTIIESAMPVAVFNYLLAARYGRHPEVVAGAILVSTVAAFILLPFVLAYAMNW